MSEFDLIYGNLRIKNTITGFASRRAFPNAFMISGEKGSGKSLIALISAMAIACESQNERPCGKCSACRKIKEGISPDVITITVPKDRKTIGIETVRELKESAYILPNDLSSKIYIIDEAERLTDQAQNALLKIFEEGPPSVYFILLTQSPSSLLSTVRSRAPELKTELFTHEMLEALLLENEKKASELKKSDPIAFRRMINASSGSYGKALDILLGKNKKTAKIYLRAEQMISYIANDDDASLLSALISETSDRENYAYMLSLIQTGLRDIILIKKGEESAPLSFFSDTERAKELASLMSLKTLIALSACIGELYTDASEININLRTASIYAFGRIKEVRA